MTWEEKKEAESKNKNSKKFTREDVDPIVPCYENPGGFSPSSGVDLALHQPGAGVT